MNNIFKVIAIFTAIILMSVAKPSFATASNICVFCSSKDSIAQIYEQEAYTLGQELAINKFGLVTGGRNTGLMKSVIDGHANIKNHMPRYAIIPKALYGQKVVHDQIPRNNVIWTADLHDRLKIFYSKCDTIVVLPGGIGTMQEMLDAIENNKFGIIKKRIYILNTNNFWAATVAQFRTMLDVGAMPISDLNNFKFVASVEELLAELKPSPNQP